MRGNRVWKPNLPEVHIAIVGANGSGKSALTVKFITRRYIGEYDPNLEDSYCKRDVVNNKECMVWIMDTVEGPNKDPNRYLAWADIFLVVYNITNRLSFEYAEELLRIISSHEHSACRRDHLIHLVGNKCDMERYRQVSKSKGAALAIQYQAEFNETNCTEEYALVRPIFHTAIDQVLSAPRRSFNSIGKKNSPNTSGHSPSPASLAPSNKGEKSSSDSENHTQTISQSQNPFSRNSRSRTKSSDKINNNNSDGSGTKKISVEKSNTLPAVKKASQGLRWFKLFGQS